VSEQIFVTTIPVELQTIRFNLYYRTWLNDNILDAEILQNTDYEIIRKDRRNKGGGRVALIYRKSIHLKRILLPEPLNLSEVIFLIFRHQLSITESFCAIKHLIFPRI
jgi:hypothetical protein